MKCGKERQRKSNMRSSQWIIWKYRKIPKINPGAYIFQRPLLRGLFLEGLICRGKLTFQNQLGFYLEGLVHGGAYFPNFTVKATLVWAAPKVFFFFLYFNDIYFILKGFLQHTIDNIHIYVTIQTHKFETLTQTNTLYHLGVTSLQALWR